MGKKAVAIIGSENEDKVRAKRDVQREQKKKRAGKEVKKEEVVAEAAPVVVEEPKKISKKIARVRSKNYQTAKAKTDINKLYSLSDALKLLREVSYSQVKGAVELHINLREKMPSRDIEIPHVTGKSKTIAVASDATLAKIEAGQIDFDVLLASPAQMAKLVKFAKILGPKGLMPNPKAGTVTENPDKKAADMAGKNTLLLKSEKDAPLIHLVIGKLAMSDRELSENIKPVLTSLEGKMNKVVIKSTMSPAIKLLLV